MDDSRSLSRSARTEAKRDRIIDAAMRHFAEHGYQGARVDDIAGELGIAKGSIFQHFGSKSGLFFEAFKKAIRSLPAWLDAPQDVLDEGFFACVRYWLEQTGHLVTEDWVPNRVALIGTYGTDLLLKREINRWLVSEDPYGTLDFVEFGIAARRGPRRHRPRADRVDPGLARRGVPGRDREPGAGSGLVPPAQGGS